MSSQPRNTHLTITLTGRAPVRIALSEWPIIAQAPKSGNGARPEHQMIVRQHEDGRAIVYGISRQARGGELLEASQIFGTDIAVVIQRVAEDLEERARDRFIANGRQTRSIHNGTWRTIQDERGIFARLAHDCTANLPAVEVR